MKIKINKKVLMIVVVIILMMGLVTAFRVVIRDTTSEFFGINMSGNLILNDTNIIGIDFLEFTTLNGSVGCGNITGGPDTDFCVDDSTAFDPSTIDYVNQSMLDNATIIRVGNVSWIYSAPHTNRSDSDINTTVDVGTIVRASNTSWVTDLFSSGDGNLTYSVGVYTLANLILGEFNNNLGWITSSALTPYQLIVGAYTATNFTLDYNAITSRYDSSNFTSDYASIGAYTATNFSVDYNAETGRYTVTNFTSDLGAVSWTGDLGGTGTSPTVETTQGLSTNNITSGVAVKLPSSSHTAPVRGPLALLIEPAT